MADEKSFGDGLRELGYAPEAMKGHPLADALDNLGNFQRYALERIAALEGAIESALVVLAIDLSDEKRWQAAEILRLALAGGEGGDGEVPAP